MRLGITGPKGFLAYNLLQVLGDRDDPPTVFGYDHDVLDRDRLTSFAADLDVLIHLAAYTDTRRADEERDRCFEVNVTGTENAIAACAAKSTKLVYVTTGDALTFSGAYAESKRESDGLIRSAIDAGRDITSARSFNLYGYRQNPTKLIPTLIRRAFLGEPLFIEGDGKQIRDYVFALDCAEALRRLTVAPAGTEVEVATGKAVSLNEIAATVIEVIDAPYASAIVHGGQRRARESDELVGSTADIQSKLGWAPEHDIRSGIKLTYEWYRNLGYLEEPPPIQSRG